MRILAVLATGATALLGACAQTPEPPPARTAVVQQDWVLIAPPDNVATVAFLETFEFLPNHKARFPGSTNGLTEQHLAMLERLFEQVAAEPAAADRVAILTEVAVLSDAPVDQWRRVRVFRSAELCHSIREELLKVTDLQTRKVGAYGGMPREEFQWPLLARSFQHSRCVPAENSPSVGRG